MLPSNPTLPRTMPEAPHGHLLAPVINTLKLSTHDPCPLSTPCCDTNRR